MQTLTSPSEPRRPAVWLAHSFVAADGLRWVVREHEIQSHGQRPPRRVLLFETRSVARWLRRYPSDWRTLPDAELEALSRRV